MRWKISAFLIVFMIISAAVIQNRAHAESVVTIDLFYQELSPYGEWSPHPEFGYIWQPVGVPPDWKPYTDGRWEWSDQGWLWISYEPWGWATYHYGRWVYDDYAGWVWIPGTTWAPAWVSWQESPEYIVWSPLPPDRAFFVEIGFFFNSYKPYYKPYKHHHHHHHKKHRYYHDYYYDPYHYKPPAKHCVFVPYGKFGRHKHAGRASVPPEHAITFRNSRNITNIRYANNKVYNYGPDKYRVEKYSKRKLIRHKIDDKHAITFRGNKNVNYVENRSYKAYRPKINRVSKDPFTTNRGSKNVHKQRKHNEYKQPSKPVSYDTQTRKNKSFDASREYKGNKGKAYKSQKSGYGKYGYTTRQQNKIKPDRSYKERKTQYNKGGKAYGNSSKSVLKSSKKRSINRNQAKYGQNSKNKNKRYENKKNRSNKSYSNNSRQRPHKSNRTNIPSSQRGKFSKR